MGEGGLIAICKKKKKIIFEICNTHIRYLGVSALPLAVFVLGLGGQHVLLAPGGPVANSADFSASFLSSSMFCLSCSC